MTPVGNQLPKRGAARKCQQGYHCSILRLYEEVCGFKPESIENVRGIPESGAR